MIYSSNFVQGENFWKKGVVSVGWEARKVIAPSEGWEKTEYPFYTTLPDASFTIESGCDGSKADCIRHNNLQNYGGYLALPHEIIVRT